MKRHPICDWVAVEALVNDRKQPSCRIACEVAMVVIERLM